MGKHDVAPKEETVKSGGRLNPKLSYQNFRWMYQMYKKPSMSHAMVGRFCGISASTAGHWYRKLGIKKYLDEDRETEKYKDWRRKVLKRDGYRCTMSGCGSRQRLHAHHIRPWAKYPKQRYLVSNGRALCEKCHKNRHPFMKILYDNKDEKR